MDDTNRSIFVTGLRDAHAMENQALSIMKPQISRIESYPAVARRLEEHVRETEQQIARLEDILGGLDETHSTVKDWALSAGGGMAAIGHSLAGDEILKNSLANYAFEHYEIAAYKALLAMAERGGFEFALDGLTDSLREEEAMASWIDEHLDQVTMQFLSLKESGQTAKI